MYNSVVTPIGYWFGDRWRELLSVPARRRPLQDKRPQVEEVSGSSDVKVRSRFNWIALRRLIPFLGYHHVLMIICIASMVLQAIIVAGCSSTSPGLPNICLVDLYHGNGTRSQAHDPRFIVRVGYFGLCVQTGNKGWICSRSENDLRSLVNVQPHQSSLLKLGSAIREQAVFPYFFILSIVFLFICFLLLATFPGWHAEVDDRTGSDVEIKPFPSRPVSQLALGLAFIASIFTLIASLWQHAASAAVGIVSSAASDKAIQSSVCDLSIGLAWTTVGFTVVVTMGLLIMVLSIQILDRLVED